MDFGERMVQGKRYFLKQFVTFGVVKLPQNFHLNTQTFTKPLYKMSDLPTFENIYNVNIHT